MSKMNAFNVSLNGKIIDTVFYNDSCDKEYVKDALINHDGFDPNIKVTKVRAKKENIPKYSLDELENMETLAQSHTDNLKFNDGNIKIWLSRMTIADGAPCNNEVTVEKFNSKTGTWDTIEVYEAMNDYDDSYI